MQETSYLCQYFMSKIRNILKIFLKHTKWRQMSKLLLKFDKARKIHFSVNQGVLKLTGSFFPENYEKNIFLPFFSYLGINIA